MYNYISSGPIAAPTIGKTVVLSPDSGKELVLKSATLLNSSGGAANVGIGFEVPDAIISAGQWDSSETPEFVDDTTDALDAGGDDFALSDADGDGFVIQADCKFNMVRFTLGTAGSGGSIASPTVSYYNGSSFATLNTITTPDFATTGDEYLVFMAPGDWAKGGAEDSNKYAIRVTFATGPTTDALADEISVVSFIDYYEGLADGASVVFEAFGGEAPIPYGASLVPYFSTANNANAVSILYRPGR